MRRDAAFLADIVEAAKRLSPELRARHAQLPWPHIISQRNRIVHGYFGLDWEMIWTSATEDVPALMEWAQRVLGEEFPAQP